MVEGLRERSTSSLSGLGAVEGMDWRAPADVQQVASFDIEGMDWRASADLQEIDGYGSSCETSARTEAPEGCDWQAPAHIDKMPDPIHSHVLASFTRFLEAQKRMLAVTASQAQAWKASADTVRQLGCPPTAAVMLQASAVAMQQPGCSEKAEEATSEQSTEIASPSPPSSPHSTRRSLEGVQHGDAANSQASSAASPPSSPSVTFRSIEPLPPAIITAQDMRAADTHSVWSDQHLAATNAKKEELEAKIEALSPKNGGEKARAALQIGIVVPQTPSPINTSTPTMSQSGTSNVSQARALLSPRLSSRPMPGSVRSPFQPSRRLVAEMAKGPASMRLPIGTWSKKPEACEGEVKISTRLVIPDHQWIQPSRTERQQSTPGATPPLCSLLRKSTPLQVHRQTTCM